MLRFFPFTKDAPANYQKILEASCDRNDTYTWGGYITPYVQHAIVVILAATQIALDNLGTSDRTTIDNTMVPVIGAVTVVSATLTSIFDYLGKQQTAQIRDLVSIGVKSGYLPSNYELDPEDPPPAPPADPAAPTPAALAEASGGLTEHQQILRDAYTSRFTRR